MDSMDLERERGITILAKNTAVDWKGVKINIVDTPGHADFGGEVERSLAMVDAVLLLVDAAEGPLPQTRFVLRKALEARLPGDPRHQQGRPPRRARRRGPAAWSRTCSSTSTRTRTSSSFPVVYTDAKRGWASLDPAQRGENLMPLFDLLLEHVPPPTHDPEHPLQAQVTNLDASPYLGRIAICRVRHGVIRKGQRIGWCRSDGSRAGRRRSSELFVTQALDRVPVDEAGPGRDHRRRRARRGHDRRDARRPRRPAAAAGDHRRRAVAGRRRSASTSRRWPARTATS